MIRNVFIISTLLAATFILSNVDADIPCIGRKYNHSSTVCVCNATYCDEISKIEVLPKGKYVAYYSNMEGARFAKIEGKMSGSTREKKEGSDHTLITIVREEQYQKIFGFGGTFTDAASLNYKKLSPNAQKNFINSYYSKDGLEYNMGRVPIGGTDFSTHPYAYNMYPENDIHLSNFSLTVEDFEYKIPMIHEAKKVATDDILLVASAWSPPVWMKTNNAFGGFSMLKGEYYQTWANYHLRFLEEYEKKNVNFWAVTTGNEPSLALIPVRKFNSLGWTPTRQGSYVANNLGPTLKNSKFSDILILVLDDQRFSMPWWIDMATKNETANKYIDGIATHWYWDFIMPVELVDLTHQSHPDKFLISTEASCGDKQWQIEKVKLGAWERGELFIESILEDLNHWYTGWIDWNLAVNRQGGPTWYSNYIDGSVIIMPEDDEFLKQPLFYAMGHFSKFLPRNSVRVKIEDTNSKIKNVAFLRPDGGVTVIIYNPLATATPVTIQERGKGSISINVQPKTVYSLVYW